MTDKKNVYKIKAINHISVRFQEVDAYRIVHNVHYFNYFEIGRSALLDTFLRKEKPSEIGLHLYVLLKASCKYANFLQLGDEVIAETVFNYNPAQTNAKIEFTHTILKKKGKILAAEGFSTIGICDHSYKLFFKIPLDVKAFLEEQLDFYSQNRCKTFTISKN